MPVKNVVKILAVCTFWTFVSGQTGQSKSSIRDLRLYDLRYMVSDRGVHTEHGGRKVESLTITNLSDKPINALTILAVAMSEEGNLSLELFFWSGNVPVPKGESFTMTSTISAGTSYQLIGSGPEPGDLTGKTLDFIRSLMEWKLVTAKRKLAYLKSQHKR